VGGNYSCTKKIKIVEESQAQRFREIQGYDPKEKDFRKKEVNRQSQKMI